MRNRITILIIIMSLYSICSYSEGNNSLSFTLAPGVNFPIGESRSYFKFGGGIGLSTEYRLSFPPPLSFKADLGYSYIPIRTKDALSIFSFGGGAGLNFTPIKKLMISAYGTGGYYYGILNDGSGESGGNLYLSAGGGVHYSIIPAISLGVGLYYLNYFYLYNGLGLSMGVAYHIPLRKPERVKIEKELPVKPKPIESDAPIKRVQSLR